MTNTGGTNADDGATPTKDGDKRGQQQRNQRRHGNGPRFTGATTGMNGHTFELPARANQFSKTLEFLHQYANITYDSASEMETLFSDPPSMPSVDLPPAEPTPTTPVTDSNGDPILDADGKPKMSVNSRDKRIHDKLIDQYISDSKELKSDLASLFAVIFGQCNEAMQSHLRTSVKFLDSRRNGNCLWLLDEIRSAIARFEASQFVFIAAHEAMCRLYNLRQGDRTNNEYYQVFIDQVAVLDRNHVWSPPPLALCTDTHLLGRSDTDTRNNIKQQFLATTFLLNADQRRYGTLVYELRNQFASGQNRFPTTVLAAYKLLNARMKNDADRQRSNNRTKTRPGGNKGGNNGNQEKGNQSGEKTTDKDITTDNRGHHQYFMHVPALPLGSILLDTGATTSLFCDPTLLTDIQDCSPPLTLHTNGGTHTAHQRGVYSGLHHPIPVWFSPTSLTNVLALCDVTSHCRVTMDSQSELSLLVHLPSPAAPSPLRFTQHDNGLYLHSPQANYTKVPLHDYSCLQSVSDNRSVFSRRDLAGADRALDLYRKLGRPSPARYMAILRDNHLHNAPVTADDAKRAFHIYGNDVAYLKGTRTDRPPAPHVPTFIPCDLPPHILQHHRDITLCVDFYYVQRQAFLHTIDRNIGFRRSIPVPDRTRRTILKHLPRIIDMYTQRGFVVRDVHADSEFECLRDALSPIALDTTTTNTHVGEVERSIRTIKERVRTTVHGMPFTRLPRLIVKELVKQAEDLCNLFPSGSGPTAEHSPAALIQGTSKPDFNSYSIEFGAYVQVYDGTNNTLKSRTFGAITLHRTGNADNSFAFMSLVTGERITRAPGFWTELPITDAAIARVHAIALEEGQPPLQHKNLVVEWRPDHEVDPDEYDKDYQPSATEHDEDDTLVYDDDETSVVFTPQTTTQAGTNALTQQGPIPDNHVGENLEGTNNEEVDEHILPDDNGHDDDSIDDNPAGFIETENGTDDGTDSSADATHAADQDHLTPQTTEPSTANQDQTDDDAQVADAPYSLRANRTRDYSHRFSHAMDNPISTKAYESNNEATQLVQVAGKGASEGASHPFVGMLFQQMSARAGYKRFGDAARDATRREFKQLIDKDVFTPVRPEHLTQKEREQSLRVVNLIKHKRDGTIKGRTCADGRKQRDLYDKSQTTSPSNSLVRCPFSHHHD